MMKILGMVEAFNYELLFYRMSHRNNEKMYGNGEVNQNILKY